MSTTHRNEFPCTVEVFQRILADPSITTKSDLARRAGLSSSMVHHVLRGMTPSANVIWAFAEGVPQYKGDLIAAWERDVKSRWPWSPYYRRRAAPCDSPGDGQ
jgi:transcriptional regulator with XRE-family HTH domain